MKTASLLFAASALTVATSCLTLVVGVVYLSAASVSAGYRPGFIGGYNLYYMYYLVVGIIGVVSFLFGLASAFFVRQHRQRVLSWLGLGLLITSGALMSYPLFFFGLPILALSIPAAVLAALSNRN